MTLFPTIENIILAPGGDVTVDVHPIGDWYKEDTSGCFHYRPSYENSPFRYVAHIYGIGLRPADASLRSPQPSVVCQRHWD